MLIIYFSRAGENYNVGNVSIGNTAMMASYIKEYLGADSFEIVPGKKISLVLYGNILSLSRRIIF